MARAYSPAEKKEAIEKKVEAKEMTVEGTTSDGRSIRRKRGVLNGTDSKLRIGNNVQGYHLHWMNDSGSRITDALEAGYEFVEPSEVGGMQNNNVTSRNVAISENRVKVQVGKDESGPIFAYLMKIKQEWYEEDQAALEERNALVDDAIRSGSNTKSGTSTEGFYVPKGGIKYQN